MKIKTLALLTSITFGGISLVAGADQTLPLVLAQAAGTTPAAAEAAPAHEAAPTPAESATGADEGSAPAAATGPGMGMMGGPGMLRGRGMRGPGMNEYCKQRGGMGMKGRPEMPGGPGMMGSRGMGGPGMMGHCKHGDGRMGGDIAERHQEVLDRLDRIEKRQAIIEAMLRELLLGRQ